jgi:hypothetical protein
MLTPSGVLTVSRLSSDLGIPFPVFFGGLLVSEGIAFFGSDGTWFVSEHLSLRDWLVLALLPGS